MRWPPFGLPVDPDRPKPAIPIGLEPSAWIRPATALRRLPENPPFHPCRGGCGTLLLAKGELCVECSAGFEKEVRRAWATNDLNIPPRYLEGYVEEKWPAGLDSWNGRDPWCVTIFGPPGTGKSMMASHLLWVLSALLGSSWWYSARQYAYSSDSDRNFKRDRCSSARLLVFDDLGPVQLGWGWDTCSNLLRDRFERSLGTIVTTNWTPAQIGARDPALLDRLREGLLVEMAGESRRGGGA